MDLAHWLGAKQRHPGRVVVALLAAYWIMAVSASVNFSAAGDEIAHIAGGIAYWRTGENLLQPENGNFPKRWAALPLMIMGVHWPDVRGPLPQSAAMDVVGYTLFYRAGNHPAAMLLAARAMIALLGVGLGAMIWWWTRRMWNDAAALLATGLFAFSPTMLAQGALATSDMAVSLLLLAAVTAYWRLLERASLGRLLVCSGAAGLLFLTKMSCVLVLPMMAVLAVIRLFADGALSWEIGRRFTAGSWAGRAAAIIGATLLAGMGAWAAVWAGFGFRFPMFGANVQPTVLLDTPWPALVASGGFAFRAAAFARHHGLLPEAWLYGFASTLGSLDNRPTFLNGAFSWHGWPWYFPYTVLVKTPLPFLALVVLGAAASLSRTHEGKPAEAAAADLWYAGSPLAVLFLVYWFFAITSHLNIGQRHVLPTYAPMFIMAGGAAAWIRGRGTGARACLVAALAVWLAVESWHIRPYYLEYFSQIAGGPREGYRHLVESNLDWGQDLPALKQWLDVNNPGGKEPVYLAYFGPGEPAAHGIRGRRLLNTPFSPEPAEVPAQLTGGLYCISATLFEGVYTKAPGPWSPGYENLYQELRRRRETGRLPLDEAIDFLHLRFRRLCQVLAAQKPDAMAGYSILIFRVSDEQVAQALTAPLDSPVVPAANAR